MLVLVSFHLIGQNNQSIYKAYISGDMVLWKNTIDSIDKQKQLTPEDRIDHINYLYGYIAYSIAMDENKVAKKYLEKAKNHLARIENDSKMGSMVNAYKAAFIGFELGLAPYKAPFIGMDSWDFAKTATLLDSTNALAYFQMGNISYYTPAIFGGSKAKAILYFQQALNILDKQPEKRKNNWNYLNFLSTLIQIYEDQKEYELAQKYCLQALKEEPNFQWVKEELYPEILKKIENE